jgi:cyclomaltodextrinase / maltogenic alpha-amylase / neopullulanase
MTNDHKPVDVASNLRKGVYRHFKGNLYELVEQAIHSETLEEYVVYRALYGERGIWVRPLSMFIEQIERDGRSIPRFEFVGDTARE